MTQEQLYNLKVGNSIWVYTYFSADYERRIIRKIERQPYMYMDSYETDGEPITFYFEGREYGVSAEDLLNDKWCVRYNHKEGKSYKKKQLLKNVKKSINAVALKNKEDKPIKLNDLQDKVMVLHTLKRKKDHKLCSAIGKIVNIRVKVGSKYNWQYCYHYEGQYYFIEVDVQKCIENRWHSFSYSLFDTFYWTETSYAEEFTEETKNEFVEVINNSARTFVDGINKIYAENHSNTQ